MTYNITLSNRIITITTVYYALGVLFLIVIIIETFIVTSHTPFSDRRVPQQQRRRGGSNGGVLDEKQHARIILYR